MIFLQAFHRHRTFLQGTYALGARARRPQGCHDRDPFAERSGSNFDFVLARNLSARGVDDELDLTVFDEVENVRAARADFKNPGNLDSSGREGGGRAFGRDDPETERGVLACDRDDVLATLTRRRPDAGALLGVGNLRSGAERRHLAFKHGLTACLGD